MAIGINGSLRKMMILFIGLYLFSLPLMAAFVQPGQAVQAAARWLSETNNNKAAPSGVASIYTYADGMFQKAAPQYRLQEDVLPQLYLLINANNTYTVVSAEDNSLPILAYSTDKSIDIENISPSVLYWLDIYQKQIQEIQTDNILLNDNSMMWAALLNGSFRDDSKQNRSVAPLVTTMWNQGWPYNALCPADAAGPGGRVYAGCVATAMGMVMKYWDHPQSGQGNHTYYANGYGYQSANFGNTTYLWDEMQDSIGMNYLPIATLLYHCGVAVNMDYAVDGSGAQSQDAAEAMVDYFRYPNAQYKSRDDYNATTWNALMKAQIDNGTPIYYSGSGSGGGHAFVLDGYSTADYYHFNFGWSGSGNGYFYTNNINPSGSDFNSWQGAIINNIPANYSIANIPVTLNAPNTTVGNIFDVSVATNPILGSWNVNHYDMLLYYDNSAINYTGYSVAGTVSENGSIVITESTPGELSVSWDSSTPLAGGGMLIKFNFMAFEQGDYLFDLMSMHYNTSSVTNTNSIMVNAVAPVANLAASQISLSNMMHLTYQAIGTSSMATTYLLPSWNVTHYACNVSFNPEKLEFTGMDKTDTMSAGLNPIAVVNTPGVVSISCDSEQALTGSGILLKLNFRAIGNSTSISVTQLVTTAFYYNSTPVAGVGTANVVLSAYSSAEDEVAVVAPLLQIYPNPFSESANFKFSSTSNAAAQYRIYNLKGQLVKQFTVQNPDKSDSKWDAKDMHGTAVSTGVYFVRWQQGKNSGDAKVLVVK
ncbi:MAG: C10 family peptidase [Candidatus Cloacimonas sp.]|nr:C10 family peptidase [Candidatus Cloacimonas sp.]